MTTFLVEPVDEGRQAEVTITTEFPPQRGLAAYIERRLTLRFLPDVYLRELAQLEAVAMGEAPPTAPPRAAP